MNLKIAADLLHLRNHLWDANPNSDRLTVLMSGFLSLAVIADD
jgi:hypothetical protein